MVYAIERAIIVFYYFNWIVGLIGILLVAVLSIVVYYLNSLFIKFLPVLYVIILGGFKYVLI